MGVLLGGLTSLLYGVGDFIGGQASRRSPAPAVVLGAGFITLPLITVASLIVGGEATAPDWIAGGAAGFCGAVGLILLFAGLARGRAASVAPVAAAVGASVPVVAGVILGERPSALAWTGVVIAIPAIVFCSWAPDHGHLKGGGVAYGLGAGSLFGAYTVVISRTAEASGLLPLIPARAAFVVVMLILAAGGVWKLSAVKNVPRGLVAAHGVLDVAGNVTLLLALRLGSLVAVSIASSAYPAVTVALARLVNGEVLRRIQVAGVGLALTALILIALG